MRAVSGDALGEEGRLVDPLVSGAVGEPGGLPDDRVLRSPGVGEVFIGVGSTDGVDLFPDGEQEANAVFAALEELHPCGDLAHGLSLGVAGPAPVDELGVFADSEEGRNGVEVRAEDDLRRARPRQQVEAPGRYLLALDIKAHLAELLRERVPIVPLLPRHRGNLDPVREIADKITHLEQSTQARLSPQISLFSIRHCLRKPLRHLLFTHSSRTSVEQHELPHGGSSHRV